MTNSKFKSACQAVGACSLIAILIMLPFLMLHHLGEHYDHEVDRNTAQNEAEYARLKKQDYITIKQFKHLFEKVQDNGDSDIFDKLNSSKVVDDSDGHVYMVNIRKSLGGSYSLTPLQNGKQAMINPVWAKEHGVKTYQDKQVNVPNNMTVAQFDRLFKKAQKANDQKALKKMNNLLVKSGKTYFRTRIHFQNGKADDHYALDFVKSGD